MAEAARAEVDADPDAAVLVLHQVDVVVARADRAELRLRQLRELALRREVGAADLVEHRVVDPLLRRHAHAERDPAGDLAHDQLDAAERVEIASRQLGARGLVAAADVVADARGRDVALVGDAAADRLRVARVMVGAEHAELGVARLHAPLELLEAPLVDGAEGLDRAHLLPPFILTARHRADSNRRSALCRRAPRPSATVSRACEAPERIRTSVDRVRSPALFR